MKVSDKKRFAAAFQSLCEIFGKESTKIMLKGYFRALERLSIDQVEAAISQAIKTCTFLPKPVELINLVPGGKAPQLEHKAGAEADRILSHMKLKGSSVWPDLSKDPITKHLMTSRWIYNLWARNMIEADEHWWRKQFVEAYQARQETDMSPQIEAAPRVLKLCSGIGGN